jgi:CRISPR-associated protein Cmr1
MTTTNRIESNVIRVAYRVVTPMFLGGAAQQPELRMASFKGVLRFWWRALAWGEILERAGGNERTALQRLRIEEAQLFGSREKGQSAVLIRLNWTDALPASQTEVIDWPPNRPPVGSTYLGYGITQSGRPGTPDYKPHRHGLPNGTVFEVSCVVSPMMPEPRRVQVRHDIERALWGIGLFAGLGSRSRRGFGSIALDKWGGKDCTVQSVDELEQSMRIIVPDASRKAELPPFTAFSRFSRVAFLGPGSDVRNLHHELGQRYVDYRGQKGQLRGKRKMPFGLPLKGVDENTRRASPILMHLHPVGEQFVAAVLYMPSFFHRDVPEGGRPDFFNVVLDWMEQLHGVPI